MLVKSSSTLFVSENTLRAVIQDLYDTGGEDADKSNKLKDLTDQLKKARKEGLGFDDFVLQLHRTLRQHTSALEGDKMHEPSSLIESINGTLIPLAMDIFTEPALTQ